MTLPNKPGVTPAPDAPLRSLPFKPPVVKPTLAPGAPGELFGPLAKYAKGKTREVFGGITEKDLAIERSRAGDPTWDPSYRGSAIPADQQNQIPGWDKLTGAERGLIEGVANLASGISNSGFGKWLGEQATNTGAMMNRVLGETAAGSVTSMVNGAVGGLFWTLDWLREKLVERPWGTIAQYQAAKEQGKGQEFFDNFGKAWEASQWWFETSGVVNPLAYERNPETRKTEMVNEMPGVTALEDVKRWQAEGKSNDEISGLLQESMGALYYRGLIADAFSGIFLDPLNLIAPEKIVGSFSAKLAMWSNTGRTIDELADVGRILDTFVEEGRQVDNLRNLHIDDLNNLTRAYDAATDVAEQASIMAKIQETGKAIAAADAKALEIQTRFLHAHQTLDAAEALTRTQQFLVEKFGGGIISPSFQTVEEVNQEVAQVGAKIEDIARSMESMPAVERAQAAIEQAKLGTQLSELNAAAKVAERVDESVRIFREKARLWKPWTWFRLRPEAAAREIFNIYGDNLKFLWRPGIADSPEDLLALAHNASSILSDPKLGMAIYTPQGRALIAAVKASEGVLGELASDFRGVARERDLLAELGRLVGKGPEGILKMLEQKKDPDVLKIIAGMMAQASPEARKTESFIAMQKLMQDNGLLSELSKFRQLFLSGKMPYNMATYKIHAIGRIEEQIGRMAIARYGLEAEGAFTKAANALKAAEGLAFLGLNPAYPLRNFFNNELTMWARNTWGGMSANEIDDFWAAIGIVPERLSEGIGAADVALREIETAAKGVSAAARGLVDDAMRGATKNWPDRFSNWLRNGKLRRKDFAYMAQQMERSASRRATTAAYMEFWGKAWVPGKGFDEAGKFMEGNYPGVAAELGDDFLKELEYSVRASRNPQEILTASSRGFRVSVDQMVDNMAVRTGRTADEVRNTLGEALLADIQRGFNEAGDSVEELQRVVRTTGAKVEEHLDSLADLAVESIADRAAAMMRANGDPTTLLHLIGEQVDETYAMLQSHLSELDARASMIRKLDPADQPAAWDQLAKETEAAFGRAGKRMEARYEGLLRGGSRYGARLPDTALESVKKYIADTKKFYQTKLKSLRAMRASEKAGAYGRHLDRMDAAYATLLRQTRQHGETMDKLLYAAIRSSDKAGAYPVVRAWRQTVHSVREGYMNFVKTFYRNLESVTEPADRALLMQKFGADRSVWMTRIHVAEREGLNMIRTNTPFGSTLQIDDVTARIFATQLGTNRPTLFQAEGDWQGLVANVRKTLGPDAPDPIVQKVALAEAQGRSVTANWHGRAEDRLNALKVNTAEIQAAGGTLRAAGNNPDAVGQALQQIKNHPDRMRWLQALDDEATTPAMHQAVRHHMSEEVRNLTPEGWKDPNAFVRKGQYGTISAKTDAIQGDEAMEAHERLRQDLIDLGYDPIEVNGRYGGTDEPSFVVPGMTDVDAYAMGRKYGQKRVLLSNHKGMLVTDPAIQNPGIDPLDWDDTVIGTPSEVALQERLADNYTEITLADGSKVRWATNWPDAAHRTWVAPLDGPNGVVQLERYGPGGHDILDPANAACRTGKEGAERMSRLNNSADYQANLQYYIKGTPPETDIAIRGSTKYTVRVASDTIYDISKDPLGFMRANRNQTVLAEKAAKEYGFLGVRYTTGDGPNTIKIFQPLVPDGSPQLMQATKGASAAAAERIVMTSPVTPAGVGGYTGTRFEKDLMEIMHLPANEAKSVRVLSDAVAEAWSLRYGKTAEEWYATHFAGMNRGWTISGGKVTARLELNAQIDNLMLSPEAMINLLGGDELPEYLTKVAKGIADRRSRFLQGKLPREFAVRAYVQTVFSQNAKEIPLDTLLKRMPEDLKDLFLSDGAFVFERGGRKWIRPEEAIAAWLLSADGVKATRNAANGIFDPDEWRAVELIRTPYGFQGNVFKTLTGNGGLPDISSWIDRVYAKGSQIAAGEVNPMTIFDDVQELKGVGTAKAGFMGHFLGFGERPTLDSRAIAAWISGKSIDELKGTPLAQLADDIASSANPAAQKYMVEAILSKFREMRASGFLPDVSDEVFGHVVHHWYWDMVKQTETSHEGSYLLYHLDQLSDVGAKGMVTFGEQSKAVITAFGKADVSTAIHELSHIFVWDLEGSASTGVLSDLEAYFGKTLRDWTPKEHEHFARAFEKYLRDGVAPTQKLKGVFEEFSDWLRNVYKKLTGSDIDVEISPELRRSFDHLLGADVKPQKPMQWSVPDKPIGVQKFQQLAPDDAPTQQGLDELWFRDGRHMLAQIEADAVNQIKNRPQNVGRVMSPNAQKAVAGYLDRQVGRLNDTQQASLRFALIKRDSALLNYTRRTNFDWGMAHIFPFSFWTTHSMWNWLMWMPDKPQVAANYLRLRNYGKQMARSQMPARFQGTVPLGKIPFMPEWMGGAYVNPLAIGLPFEFWGQPFEQVEQDAMGTVQRVQTILQERLDNGEISDAEYRQAMTAGGPVFDSAMVKAQESKGDSVDGFDMIQSLLAPHAPIVWAWHLANGTADQIGPFLPITRTIKGVTALLGWPGGGLNIEAGFRKAVGLPAFDKFEEYRQERMLTNMISTGEVDVKAGQLAMIQHAGPIWEEAVKRAGIESGVPALTGALGIPIRFYPEGEKVGREISAGLTAAFDAQRAGDKEAVSRYFDDHPEVAGRLALYDKPEERLHKFLVDEMWDKWNGLTSLERRAVTDSLGDQFSTNFLESGSAESIPTDVLSTWLRMLGSDVPGTLGTKAPSTIEAGSQMMAMPPKDIANRAQAFYTTRKQRYQNASLEDIFALQTTFFSITGGSQRDAFLKRHPLLRDYWDWRTGFLKRNPDLVPYLVEDEKAFWKSNGYKTATEAEKAYENQPNFTLREWSAVLPPEVFRLMMDTVGGDTETAELKKMVAELAAGLGTTPEQVWASLRQSMENEAQGG